jgi:hypothetical protein
MAFARPEIMKSSRSHSVIPAKAGIQPVQRGSALPVGACLDPRLRGDDGDSLARGDAFAEYVCARA